MNTTVKTLSIAIAALSFANISSASSDSFAPGDSDSKWVVGLGTTVGTNVYRGEDNLGIIYPNVEYRGERFFFKDGQLGFSALQMGNFSGGLLLSSDISFLSDKGEYSDNKTLAGLKERDGTLEGGFYINHSTNMGRLKLTVLSDVAGEHDGQTVSLNYTGNMEMAGWNINPYVGATWASEDKINHHFGVSADEANTYRAAYQGKSSSSVFAGVRGRYEFTKNWDINLAAGVARLGSGITNSSIVDEKNIYHGSVGVNYNF
jgi:outer membrane protein